MHLSLQQLADQYAARVGASLDKWGEARLIADEINELPLTLTEKHRVVDLAAARFGIGTNYGHGSSPRSEHGARAHLDIVRAIKQLLK